MQDSASASSGDLQTRLISPCLIERGKEVVPNVPALFRRLLLFETYILQTIRFKEFPPLVHSIGVKNVLALLNSGALQLELDPTQIVNVGQLPEGPSYSRGKPQLPLLSYAFSILRPAHANEYLVRSLLDVRRELYGYIGSEELSELESALVKALRPVPEDTGLMASSGHDADLRANSPVLRKALALVLRKTKQASIPESQLKFRIVPIDDTDFKAESNLTRFGVTTDEEHAFIERALLANGGLNSRIENMRNYNALSGFIDGELPLFAGRMDFLTSTLSPGQREKTFDRVIKIRKLPSFELVPPNREFDAERFLDIRASKQCTEFRGWLKTINTASDQEIHDRVATIRAKLGPFVQGDAGKAIRIAISVLSGLVPGLGMVTGAAWSAVDCYLLEKIFPTSGPTAFLGHAYKSLFGK